jgi:hypothetical protein
MRKGVLAAVGLAFLAAVSWSAAPAQAMAISAPAALKGASDTIKLEETVHCWGCGGGYYRPAHYGYRRYYGGSYGGGYRPYYRPYYGYGYGYRPYYRPYYGYGYGYRPYRPYYGYRPYRPYGYGYGYYAPRPRFYVGPRVYWY